MSCFLHDVPIPRYIETSACFEKFAANVNRYGGEIIASRSGVIESQRPLTRVEAMIRCMG